jgi:hypothetical protein
VSVMLNHTIVWCRDKKVSAGYLVEVLGLGDAKPWGPFMIVELANGVSLDYHNFYGPVGEILSQHYAFLVSEDDFDEIFGRIRAGGQDYWADPGLSSNGDTTTMTADADFTSTTPTGISWRSSPTLTAREVRLPDSATVTIDND